MAMDMAAKKPSKGDIERLNKLLGELKGNLEEAVEISSKLNFTSHERILIHLISHVQTLQESLSCE